MGLSYVRSPLKILPMLLRIFGSLIAAKSSKMPILPSIPLDITVQAVLIMPEMVLPEPTNPIALLSVLLVAVEVITLGNVLVTRETLLKVLFVVLVNALLMAVAEMATVPLTAALQSVELQP